MCVVQECAAGMAMAATSDHSAEQLMLDLNAACHMYLSKGSSGAAAEEWAAAAGTPHHCCWHGEANEGEPSAVVIMRYTMCHAKTGVRVHQFVSLDPQNPCKLF